MIKKSRQFLLLVLSFRRIVIFYRFSLLYAHTYTQSSFTSFTFLSFPTFPKINPIFLLLCSISLPL